MKLSITVSIDGAELTRDYYIEEVPPVEQSGAILTDMIESAIKHRSSDSF